MSQDELYISDTRSFNFVGVGAGHKVLSDQARVNERKKERATSRSDNDCGADYTKRVDEYLHSTTSAIVVVAVAVSRNDLRRSGLRNIFIGRNYALARRMRAHLGSYARTSVAIEKPMIKYDHNNFFRDGQTRYQK